MIVSIKTNSGSFVIAPVPEQNPGLFALGFNGIRRFNLIDCLVVILHKTKFTRKLISQFIHRKHLTTFAGMIGHRFVMKHICSKLTGQGIATQLQIGTNVCA